MDRKGELRRCEGKSAMIDLAVAGQPARDSYREARAREQSSRNKKKKLKTNITQIGNRCGPPSVFCLPACPPLALYHVNLLHARPLLPCGWHLPERSPFIKKQQQQKTNNNNGCYSTVIHFVRLHSLLLHFLCDAGDTRAHVLPRPCSLCTSLLVTPRSGGQ
jgi:hypothetical protein